jgi:protein DGCR14
MFPPDADVTPYEISGSAAANRARGEPKVIKHGNTRLPEQEESTDSRSISAPPSPTRSRIDAAIAGTPCKLCHHMFDPHTNYINKKTAQGHQQ